MTPAEYEALLYLPLRAQVVYVMELRRFMDSETGIVGIKRRISLKSLAEVLEVRPDRGNQYGCVEVPSRDQVRSALRQLQRAGLLSRVPGYEHTLVFRCDLACTALVRPDSPPHVHTTLRGGLHTTPKPNNGAGLNGRPPHVHTTLRGGLHTTHLKDLSLRGSEIADNFQPSDEDRAFAKAHRLPDPDTELPVFIAHYQLKDAAMSNREWHALFRKWLSRARVFNIGRVNHGKASGRTRRTGAQIGAEGCAGAFEDD